MDQPGKVANPARGQLNRENNIPLSPCVPDNLVSRDGFSRPVPRQSAHLHTQAESGAYLRDSSRVPRRRQFMKPPYAIGSVPSLSGHAIAYRWRSLPRVRRHRASKPQGSSERVVPWQVTMDQLIFASLSHTHYWYEVGMLKVPYLAVGHIFTPIIKTWSGERARCVGLFQGCTGLWTAGCWLARRLHHPKASTTMDLGISIFFFFCTMCGLEKLGIVDQNWLERICPICC